MIDKKQLWRRITQAWNSMPPEHRCQSQRLIKTKPAVLMKNDEWMCQGSHLCHFNFDKLISKEIRNNLQKVHRQRRINYLPYYCQYTKGCWISLHISWQQISDLKHENPFSILLLIYACAWFLYRIKKMLNNSSRVLCWHESSPVF